MMAQQGANSPEPQDPQAVQIYQQKCARCHGAEGEGTADYPKPLAGTKSLEELARFIEETMPEDDPESCVGQEAERVARYIYEAFYSPIAQARRAPPRIALSRLTANQLRQVLADLVGGWAAAPAWDDQRGLEAEYYDGRSFRRDKRQIQRRDPLIDFHFGNESPAPGTIGSEEFAIRWQGGLYVPQTGEYQIAIESDNGVRLWLNDMNAPLIDRWVRSGDERLHRATLFLLGGRVYPLRLEFMKFKEKTASVRLLWRMPHRVLEPIPNRYLSPHRYQPVFVATTPFPPEDRSQGYTRGSSVSLEWQQALVDAALQTASFVAENADRLAGTRPDAGDRAERLKEYCRLLAERAFRRPLNAQEQERFVDRPFQLHASPVDAAKQSVLAVLLSPQFVYVNLPWEDSSIEPYARAAQLSLALWDSLPDEPLWRAAREGKTMDAGELRRQAERMVRDLRARAKLGGFVEQWLKLDQMHDVVKDPQLYPGFTPELVSDLRASLDLFLDDVLWGANADWRRLLLADYVYANARMAEFYGWQLPETPGDTQPFVKVVLERDRYAGLLTHPLLMSGFAYTSTSSPIHRGVFVARSLLGKFLRPPPEAVAPLAPDLHPELTTRARVELQTSPTQCQTCHAMINSLGFLLENYDAVGRYRLLEKNRPIDASGRYRQPDGTDVALQGARALAEYLASSDESARAFVLQLFQHAVGQPLAAYGSNTLNELTARFREQGYSVPDLLVEIACRAASLPVATNPALSVAPLPTTTPH
ncbi:MAG: hypothetical protein KatS3mg110_1381 [Pirellulaceae bacterium]|nr:MAG: hypothetical protein KatS3mg110_1381 [Pirellulaceae bacterium]